MRAPNITSEPQVQREPNRASEQHAIEQAKYKVHLAAVHQRLAADILNREYEMWKRVAMGGPAAGSNAQNTAPSPSIKRPSGQPMPPAPPAPPPQFDRPRDPLEAIKQLHGAMMGIIPLAPWMSTPGWLEALEAVVTEIENLRIMQINYSKLCKEVYG